MDSQILTVSDCISLINQTLEYAYPSVVVEGEVASFKISKGKFAFFDVKDSEGVLGCFMMAYALRSPLEDGMKVRLVAQPRLTAWGKFSLTVREVVPVGEGSIKRSFQLLMAKLQKEGLFDEARKRTLPEMPRRIGLIASVESAGYADFVKILNQRWGGVEVQVADVQVQGTGASQQILNALQYFNEQADPADAVVLVRGGGSAEDLAVFNDEPLVRAVAASRIPTLVGVGHEVDTSLCDLVADVRAATPSNAAQLLVPDRHAILRETQHKQIAIFDRLMSRTRRIEGQVRTTAETLLGRMQYALGAQQKQLAYAEQLLRQMNPKAVLARGYSLVRDQQGKIVRDKAAVGNEITIETAQLIVKAGVTHVTNKEK